MLARFPTDFDLGPGSTLRWTRPGWEAIGPCGSDTGSYRVTRSWRPGHHSSRWLPMRRRWRVWSIRSRPARGGAAWGRGAGGGRGGAWGGPWRGRGLSWKALDEAVRLCRWQRQRVILAIDDCEHLTDPAGLLDLERLVHLDPHPDSRLTVLLVFRTDEAEGSRALAFPWELLIR